MVYSSFFKHANAANKTNKIYNTVQLIIQEFNIIFSASCSCFYKLYFMDIDFDIDYYNDELDSTRLDIKKKIIMKGKRNLVRENQILISK